ncbi:MAG: hypothetical protein U5K84_01515 [Alkalibacterium sp.]|nr:hypothetical protein [Alkalibacterium sp.]
MKQSRTRSNLVYTLTLFIIMFVFIILVGFELNIFLAFLISIGLGVLLLNTMNGKAGGTAEKSSRA